MSSSRIDNPEEYIEEQLEQAKSGIKTAKETEDIDTEIEEWRNAISYYHEGLTTAEQEGLDDFQSRIRDHIGEANSVVSKLSDRKEMIERLEAGRTRISEGNIVLDKNLEAAMNSFLKAGESYLKAAKIANERQFSEIKQIERKLYEIRKQIQTIEVALIRSDFEEGLSHLAGGSSQQAQKSYEQVEIAIDEYAIDLPENIDIFQWRTESNFYRPILSILEEQITAGIDGFEKGNYEVVYELFDMIEDITLTIEETIIGECMENTLRQAEVLTEECQLNKRKIKQILYESKSHEDVSLNRPNLNHT